MSISAAWLHPFGDAPISNLWRRAAPSARARGWHPQAIAVGWPGDRVPVSVLLDDAIPCRNPAWYEFPDQGHCAEIPNRFVEQFARMIARTGAAGKFSVVPCPGGQGRIDEGMPGVAPEDLAGFLRLVRDRIAPRWDISPELLTHNRAIDLATMQLLDEREDQWAAHQDEATLTAYITHALQILQRAGLAPTGITSPWAFGQEVEEAYRGAIARSLRTVCGIRGGWYFLHVEGTAARVLPRVERLDRTAATSLVSIASGCHHDFAWETQEGQPADPDLLITADGRGGRLASLIAAGSPATFHTHWQSLFSNGSGAGLAALEEVCNRINRAWGGRITWMSAGELSTYAAAAQATRVYRNAAARCLRFRAPIPCRNFTLRLAMPNSPWTPQVDGVALQHVDPHTPLTEGQWSHAGSTAVVCLALRDGLELEWR